MSPVSKQSWDALNQKKSQIEQCFDDVTADYHRQVRDSEMHEDYFIGLVKQHSAEDQAELLRRIRRAADNYRDDAYIEYQRQLRAFEREIDDIKQKIRKTI